MDASAISGDGADADAEGGGGGGRGSGSGGRSGGAAARARGARSVAASSVRGGRAAFSVVSDEEVIEVDGGLVGQWLSVTLINVRLLQDSGACLGCGGVGAVVGTIGGGPEGPKAVETVLIGADADLDRGLRRCGHSTPSGRVL